jgi:hypothetical protein
LWTWLTIAKSTQVSGTVTASDTDGGALLDARNAMITAYNNAAGRAATATETAGGILGGQVLTPGVYDFGTGVTVNGNLVLSGGPNDVFIFSIA